MNCPQIWSPTMRAALLRAFVRRLYRGAGRAWTPAEDDVLRSAVAASAPNLPAWPTVAAELVDRDARACRQRWTRTLAPHLARGRWSPSEARAAADLSRTLGNDYAGIAVALPTARTGAQVRERILESGRSGRSWTAEEDAALARAVERHGRRWVRVAEGVEGRSDAQCLERWSLTVDPNLRKGKWDVEEDGRLGEAVRELMGEGIPFDFGEVARRVGGRSRKACRARWAILRRRGEGDRGEGG